MVVGRFAPSPSGVLHSGNLTTALLSWLDIRLRGGRFIIRVDDLDTTRCKPEFVSGNLSDLELLGIDWDDVTYQTHHSDEYHHYFDYLRKEGYVYACRCSRSDSASFDENGRYLSICKNEHLSFSNNAARLITEDRVIGFNDRLIGPYHQNMAVDVGDFIIKRKDSMFAYHLGCAIDEHRLGVSDILRGADLVDSTPRQIYLMKLLGFNVPSYAHVPLVKDQAGYKLSKRSRLVSESLFNRVKPEDLVGGIAGSLNLTDGHPISAMTLLKSIDYISFNESLSIISNKELT